MHEVTHFGHLIKRLRTEHDLTQEMLAERVGCAPQTIRLFEGGQRRPSRELAERLAKGLAVPEADHESFLRLARTKVSSSASTSEEDTVVRAPTRPSLPLPPTPLIGRQHELSVIVQHLTDSPNRLVTIVGPGGAGKTRLAIQAAHDLAPTLEDGVVFVPLANVMQEQGIAPAIVAALGYRLHGGLPPEDEVLQLLRDRDLLLVLDNLEHLLDAAAFVARLIEQAPSIRLLATSRERLRLQAEWLIELGGLAVPQTQTHSGIAYSESVLLFVERARRVSGDFVLTPENQETVALICRRLDGLPLALELAAAQISFLPPATLLRRLDRALPLLVDGARDLPERQRTMHAAIEWSYQLLPQHERELFERLAVFAGGFSLEAVEAVGADEQIDAHQVLRLLRRLIDQSLVVRDAVGDQVRYRMLEPIRQFAVEQLAARGAAQAVHDRHASFFLAFAEQAAPMLQSTEQIEWLAMVEQEHPNLRAAMNWLLAQANLDRASRLCWALWLFMWMRGHLAEGRRWVEQMLTQRAVAAEVRGRILLCAMVIGFGQGAYSWAASFIDECRTIYQGLDDPLNLAHATSTAALNYAGIQQYDAAEPLMDLGVQRYLAVGSTWNAAMLLSFWSAIPRNRGDFATAKQLTEQALALAQQHGDRVTMYSSLYNLASIAQAQSVYTDALRHFRSALALAVEIGDGGNMVSCLEAIAAVRADQGDIASAAKLWGAAEALLERNEAAVYSYATDRSQYAQLIDRVRSLVPKEHWTALWNTGRTQRLDQTLALAQHDEPTLADQPVVPSDGLLIAETGEILTPRELDVLRLIGQGLRNRVIAERLVISEKTVQNHISNIFAKLQVSDRSAAIIWATQHNVIDV